MSLFDTTRANRRLLARALFQQGVSILPVDLAIDLNRDLDELKAEAAAMSRITRAEIDAALRPTGISWEDLLPGAEDDFEDEGAADTEAPPQPVQLELPLPLPVLTAAPVVRNTTTKKGK